MSEFKNKFEWELINETFSDHLYEATTRMRIPNGYLYRTSTLHRSESSKFVESITFVPLHLKGASDYRETDDYLIKGG